MAQELFDWLLLLGRWLHIVAAVAWIGNSFFFMWLDRSLHDGELWMVHGGGFYRVQKLQMGPTKVPALLHWFKWESYWTWLSGIYLLTLMFYLGGGTFLLDSSVSSLNYVQALTLSLGTLVVSWLVYDFLWESKLAKNLPLAGHALTIAWFAAAVYVLCHTLSGRAAYIHVGALLGTWMTANVFLRIIPRQVKMVEAAKRGESVNPDWGKNAKNRSTHNTYFTLPVIFIMLSNHFPQTYGNRYHWLILLAISAAGAAIREYFVCRVNRPSRAQAFGAIGVVLLLATIALSRENTSATPQPAPVAAAPARPAAVPTAIQGAIRGTVSFEGAPPPRERLSLPLTCDDGKSGPVLSNELLIRDGKIQNALVQIVKGIDKGLSRPAPATPVILDQKKCIYEPRVVVARVGQNVDILNSDPTFHNVRSFSKNNENFNLAMPLRDQRITRVFTRPEIVVETKCSVHPWMSASIAVVDHSFYSLTDGAGNYVIPDVPAGTYTVEVWHEVLGKQTREIKVEKDENRVFDFVYQAK